MAGHVSHRLTGAFEGALAGGGDPATSPLYVFGPYLRLLAVGGAGAAVFGTPIWMVVATVFVVSLMYRHVMAWVPDGSGGSGLCEEEFGGWAVKVNAAITAIEYTLTFLVSLAALVTFVADRAGGLGHWPRVGLALALSVVVGVVVNRGPRLAARVFGPATAAVLALLWVLVLATIVRRGFHLPSVSLDAFRPENLQLTFGGYVRLLALMTGIEVFANLVAAYDGSAAERARKAFGSLIIVMTTTLVTMVIVGPAIYELADPARTDVSVFTQVMDQLLPAPVAYAGTLIGIIVLLSAAAASAQGLQNLALGLRHRHYVPAAFGQRNRFDVADRPIVGQVLLVCACFVAFGTHEETYLALYAAGVFVLLGLTGWASVRRLARQQRAGHASALTLAGTTAAAAVTTGAAALIFVERFVEGAWAYVVLVPAVYAVFTYFRQRLGAPTPLEENLGRRMSELKSFVAAPAEAWPRTVLAVVDGSQPAEAALVSAAHLARTLGVPWGVALVGIDREAGAAYWTAVQAAFRPDQGLRTCPDEPALVALAEAEGFDLLVATREMPLTRSLARRGEVPVLVVHGESGFAGRYAGMGRLVVGLDGSTDAEAVLPVVARLMSAGASTLLVSVPDGDPSEATLRTYAGRVAEALRPHGTVEVRVGGSGPARTIAELAVTTGAALVVVGSHGRGGGSRRSEVPLGSVPERLYGELACAMLVIPVRTPMEVVP